MKCLILCVGMVMVFSSGFGFYRNQREIRVDGNRRLLIQDARKMVIFNVPKDEPKVIEIITKDDRLMKIIKINDDKEILKEITLLPGSAMVGLAPENGKDKTKADDDQRGNINRQMTVLTNILKKYEGFVGEGNFYQLLKEIKQSVQRQELHPIIFDVIKEFEVNPTTNRDSTERREDLKEDRMELYEKAGKLQKLEDSDEKMKLAQALQATRQIQWIQSLLENKRKQQLEDSFRPNTDLFLRSSRDHINREEDFLKETVLQINIRELEREITRQQIESRQLRIQLQFLIEQKQQVKLVQPVGSSQNPNSWEREAYKQIKEHVERLVDEQLRIEKTILKLQENLLEEIEELKNTLRKENK